MERIIDSKDMSLGVLSLKRYGYFLRSVKTWLEKLEADQGVKGLLWSVPAIKFCIVGQNYRLGFD